jgi:hypothetical protein
LRTRLRQVDQSPNAEAERVQLEIPQSKATQVYYQTCGSVDSHNRKRQDDLDIEKKTVRTHSWDERVNLTVFGMCVVDAYLVYASCTQLAESQNDFYSGLAEEMIDNTLEYVSTRGRARALQATNELIDASPHLTPSRKKRKKDGKLTSNTVQGNCRWDGCRKSTIWLCSLSKKNDPDGPDPWYCHNSFGKTLDNASKCIVWKHTEALMMNRIDDFMFILLIFLAS